MRLYLFDDLMNQRSNVVKRFWQFMLFMILLIISDRVVGLVLLNGEEKYFGLSEPAQILLVGYSHLELGVDKLLLERELKKPVAKYTMAGSTLRDRKLMVEHYLNRNPESVKLVIFDVDSHLFNTGGLSSNSYKLFYPFMDDPAVAGFVKGQASSLSEYGLRTLLHTTRYNDATLGLAIRGHLHNWQNYKHGQVNIDLLKLQIMEGKHPTIDLNQEQMDIFQSTIEILRARGIKVLLFYVPTLDIYNEVEPQKHEQATAVFESMAANDSGVYFLDYNPYFSNNHDIFRDPVHVNAEGQKLVSDRLVQDIRSEIFNNE